MPYIKPEKRDKYTKLITEIKGVGSITDAGELNYLITTLINKYLVDNGISYDTLHSVTGVLIDAKDEFKRRVVDPYEDTALFENGEVYTVRARRGITK